jgi:hypothetical protein
MGDDSKALRELADQLRATSERLRKESDDLSRRARELEEAIRMNNPRKP